MCSGRVNVTKCSQRPITHNSAARISFGVRPSGGGVDRVFYVLGAFGAAYGRRPADSGVAFERNARFLRASGRSLQIMRIWKRSNRSAQLNEKSCKLTQPRAIRYPLYFGGLTFGRPPRLRGSVHHIHQAKCYCTRPRFGAPGNHCVRRQNTTPEVLATFELVWYTVISLMNRGRPMPIAA